MRKFSVLEPETQQFLINENSQYQQSHISGIINYNKANSVAYAPGNLSKIAYIEKRSFAAGEASRITVIELYDPIPPP